MRIFAQWQKQKQPISAEVAAAKVRSGQGDVRPVVNGTP